MPSVVLVVVLNAMVVVDKAVRGSAMETVVVVPAAGVVLEQVVRAGVVLLVERPTSGPTFVVDVLVLTLLDTEELVDVVGKMIDVHGVTVSIVRPADVTNDAVNDVDNKELVVAVLGSLVDVLIVLDPSGTTGVDLEELDEL